MRLLNYLIGILLAVAVFAGAPAEAAAYADSPREVEAVIRATWPDDEEDFAIHVAECESGLGADIYNESSGAYGIFQFLPSTAAYANADYAMLASPWYASWQAAQLQNAAGWGQWACAGY